MRKPRKKKKPGKGAKPFPYPHWIEWNQINWKNYGIHETPERIKGLWLVKLPGSNREYFVPETDVDGLPDGTMVTRPGGTWYVVGATVADIFSD